MFNKLKIIEWIRKFIFVKIAYSAVSGNDILSSLEEILCGYKENGEKETIYHACIMNCFTKTARRRLMIVKWEQIDKYVRECYIYRYEEGIMEQSENMEYRGFSFGWCCYFVNISWISQEGLSRCNAVRSDRLLLS